MSVNFVCNAYDEGLNHEKVNCMKNLIRNLLTAPDRLWLKVNCKKNNFAIDFYRIDERSQFLSI